MVTGEEDGIGPEPDRECHRHFVDDLSSGLFADAHRDAGFPRPQRFDVGTVERQRDHAVSQPVLEVAAHPFHGLRFLRRRSEVGRCVAVVRFVVEAVHGEEPLHGGIDALVPIGVVDLLIGGERRRRIVEQQDRRRFMRHQRRYQFGVALGEVEADLGTSAGPDTLTVRRRAPGNAAASSP